MYKLFNILFFILVFIFFLGVYKYYSSTKNLKVKNFNRNNIDKIINDKISELHTLKNDTMLLVNYYNRQLPCSQMRELKQFPFYKL